MRLTSFIKIIELQFPEVVCQLIDENTSCIIQAINRKDGCLQQTGYISTWDRDSRSRKRTKRGSYQVTYIRDCHHKGIRTLALLHGIKLVSSRKD